MQLLPKSWTNRFENGLRKILKARGYERHRRSPHSDIQSFFDAVHPIQTEIPLIRLGPETDGGYLVPDDLIGLSACFSPGVGAVAGFEADIAIRGIACHLADFSVEAVPAMNPLFSFEKKFIGVTNDDTYMRLADWVGTCPGDLLLQMDIEGGEYAAILDTPLEVLERFRVMIVEFHSMHLLFDYGTFDVLQSTFSKLLQNHSIVHIHPNNSIAPQDVNGFAVPPVMEFTFLRNDRFKQRAWAQKFPHALDHGNIPQGPDYTLPDCWIGRD